MSLTVSSDTYVHAVHFNFDDRIRLSDEYFDLLPKESRQVTAIPGGRLFDAEAVRPGHAGQPAPEPELNVAEVQRTH